eukprot:TRINITY_DN6687_c0_g1_i1.p1 TRINITY_DN6687_c0_g1~~TRINITY_DN6687_c0_g1_i1.p1  ORF type:complete len:133 (-),score=20.69 TRINITY_DN6687_c0_g1_i1:92-490(-)
MVAQLQVGEIVVVERDYTFGETVQFFVEVPESLKARIGQVEFGTSVAHVNSIFLQAHKIGKQSKLAALVAPFTCFLTYWFTNGQYQTKMDNLTQYLADINSSLFSLKGLELLHPSTTGFMSLPIRVTRSLLS